MVVFVNWFEIVRHKNSVKRYLLAIRGSGKPLQQSKVTHTHS
jgi:hypothetical protein